ncbi:SNF2-related protein [Corynebacterium urealyticum]|uniref:SNF2-related protein n=1 Tax=Corynebacterium urealyticum TaxID=43771 RepID=UPI0022B22343|nr:SNF2-related protein [Corynebacterium urealyticum]
MNIDGQEVTAQRIDSLIDGLVDVRYHWEATTQRVNRLREGGPAPTLCSEDSARLFGLGQNLSTAAFLRNIAAGQAPSIPWNEVNSSLQTVGEIPTRDELEQQRPELKKLAEYRGLRRLFRSRPQAQIDTYRRYAAIDGATVHSILTGVDAALGSTDRGQFLGIDLATMRPAITSELEKLTGWEVHWHQPEDIDVHRQALARLAEVEATEKSLLAEVESQQRSLKTKLADAELRQTDIQILDQLTPSTSLRLGPLQHLNLLDIEAATVSDLTRYDGVGEQTARQAIAAAKRYAAEMRADQPAVIDYRDKGPSTAYVRALAELLQFREQQRETQLEGPFLALPEGFDAYAQGVSEFALARPADGPRLITQAELAKIPARGAPLSTEQAWHLYAIRAAEFHAFGDDKSATAVPEDIAKSIEEITLRGVLHASLRGYQDFGARYALAQRKVLIGDEMGLGKTMQALAVFAHLAARGEKHFLVVCPPSLRINWEREIKKIHGS